METVNISEDYIKCRTCSISDHEGQFCRCEDRNIRIAKEKRLRKENPYRKDQTCNHCNNPESILTPETCCTGCSKLQVQGSNLRPMT